jgi:putative nucleotidyltransferase with HDIG domain
MQSIHNLQLDLRKLVFMLAHTVDLVGVDDYYHGRRVGMLLVRLAQRLGYEPARQQQLYDAGLLHDCGVSTTREHRSLLNEIEWSGAQRHCQVGHDRLADFAPLQAFAPLILHHHSRWSELLAQGIDPEIAANANLIFLADRIDVLAAPYYADVSLLGHTDEIRAIITRHRGDIFAAQLVDAFLAESASADFWMPLLSTEEIQAFQASMVTRADPIPIDWQTFTQAARIFAQIVDAKSPYTQEHSSGVSRLARFMAERRGFDSEHCDQIEVAGLLHDIGKMQIPDEILEAPRRLTEIEFDRMKTHAYVTFQILHGAGVLEDVALWASQHHERLDGSGYPFRLRDPQICLESRIIGVADIYQALAQDRPYRAPIAPVSILGMLRHRVSEGELDGTIVDIVASNLDGCQRAAMGDIAAHGSMH